jgi:hemolysin activation/secretion protein
VLQPVLFLEAGRSINETAQFVPDLGSAGTRHTLVAHGAGLRWWLGNQLSLRMDVARHHMGLPGESRWRAHGSLTLSF